MAMDTGQLQRMRDYYNTGVTLPYSFRRQQLQLLKEAINKYEAELAAALYKDLHKSEEESYVTEIGFTLAEISFALRHLQSWMRPAKVSSPVLTFPSRSKIMRDPWGVGLIVAPWNYPVNLLLSPLVGAIAGGNCALLKPSELVPNTAQVIGELIKNTYSPEYISVVQGDGSVVVPELLQSFRFDHVFFTGSVPVGKEIAKLTAEHFIPTVLELGGKSPCIVDKDVDIATAAKRIAWGKFTNAGQTCVAPDYLLVHESRKDELVGLLQKCITQFYGEDPSRSGYYGRIINDKRFDKLVSYLPEGNILTGGSHDKRERYIAPTLMDGVGQGQPVMQEEIFGPILPIITYRGHEEAIAAIGGHANPLSLYLFTKNQKVIDEYERRVSFGGGCINNTLVHLANPKLPFGGVATSGIGMYHGKYSYDTYTRPKSVIKTGTWLDAAIKYPPYEGRMKLFKWMLK